MDPATIAAGRVGDSVRISAVAVQRLGLARWVRFTLPVTRALNLVKELRLYPLSQAATRWARALQVRRRRRVKVDKRRKPTDVRAEGPQRDPKRSVGI